MLTPAKKLYLACVISVLSIKATIVYAEPITQPATNNDSIQLDTIVITATPQSSPVTVVTDPKQPRQPVPASDGADYLKTIPGFSVIRKGGANGDPVFRGMFGSRLNILTNGGTILGGCGGRMDSPTSYISPETYDRITLIKGPESVIWGPTGSAGTILFERDPHYFYSPSTHMSGDILIGTDGRLDKNLDATAGNKYGYLRFTGNQSKAKDYHDGDNHRVHSKWDKWNGDIALGITPDPDTLLELTAGRGNGQARYADRGMDGSRFLRESYGIRFEKSNIGDVLDKVEAQVYYNYINHIMDNHRLRHMNPPTNWMESNPDRRSIGGRLSATWKWADFKLQAGVDGKKDTHRNKNRISAKPMVMLTSHGWTKDAYFSNYGTFAELTWYLSDLSKVISGARVDHYYGKDYRTTDSTKRAVPAQDRSATLPSGFIRFEHNLADTPTILYAGIGHTQRFPDYWELISPYYDSHKQIIFKKIKPEKTTQIDVGLQYDNDRFNAWASGYLGWISDYIIFTQQAKQNRANNIDARIMGGELGASYKLTDNWKAETSLAYSWGRNSSDGRALPQIPPIEMRTSLNYHYDKWSAGALWRLVGAQHRVAKNQGNVTGKDFGKSTGFAIFSINLGYEINKNVALTAGIDNLFNKYYIEHLNRGGASLFGYTANQQIPEPGRMAWAKLSFEF